QLAAAEHAGDEQVDVAIAVVVERHRVGSPASALQPGLFRDIRERAVAVVAVQYVVLGFAENDAAELALPNIVVRPLIVLVGGPGSGVGQEEVKQTVVVVVKEHRSLGMPEVAEPGLFSDVREGSIAHIAEQDVAAARTRYEQIEQPIVVVVDESG